MIRKAIIAVLTLAAVGTGLLWLDSYRAGQQIRELEARPAGVP